MAKEYLDDIGKPHREKGKRGRPKDINQVEKNKDRKLQIVEEGIVKIYEALNGKFEKIILEGNERKS